MPKSQRCYRCVKPATWTAVLLPWGLETRREVSVCSAHLRSLLTTKLAQDARPIRGANHVQAIRQEAR